MPQRRQNRALADSDSPQLTHDWTPPALATSRLDAAHIASRALSRLVVDGRNAAVGHSGPEPLVATGGHSGAPPGTGVAGGWAPGAGAVSGATIRQVGCSTMSVAAAASGSGSAAARGSTGASTSAAATRVRPHRRLGLDGGDHRLGFDGLGDHRLGFGRLGGFRLRPGDGLGLGLRCCVGPDRGGDDGSLGCPGRPVIGFRLRPRDGLRLGLRCCLGLDRGGDDSGLGDRGRELPGFRFVRGSLLALVRFELGIKALARPELGEERRGLGGCCGGPVVGVRGRSQRLGGRRLGGRRGDVDRKDFGSGDRLLDDRGGLDDGSRLGLIDGLGGLDLDGVVGDDGLVRRLDEGGREHRCGTDLLCVGGLLCVDLGLADKLHLVGLVVVGRSVRPADDGVEAVEVDLWPGLWAAVG